VIFSPSSCFLFIVATRCKTFTALSAFPESTSHRADSANHLQSARGKLRHGKSPTWPSLKVPSILPGVEEEDEVGHGDGELEPAPVGDSVGQASQQDLAQGVGKAGDGHGDSAVGRGDPLHHCKGPRGHG